LALRLLLDLEFDKWRRKAGLPEVAIRQAADEIVRGLVDARLGGFLLKKRVAGTNNKGKRGSYRTIIAYRDGDKMVFLHGFAKNEVGNLDRKERIALIKLGDTYIAYDSGAIDKMINLRLIIEVKI
jgi:hypothetical protein